MTNADTEDAKHENVIQESAVNQVKDDAQATQKTEGTSKSQPKSTVKSAQGKERVFEVGDTQEPQNQGQDMGNNDDQPNVEAAPKHDWFKKPKRPLTPDSNWNVRKIVDFRPPQTWISKIAQAEKPSLSFDELMSTPIDFSACNNPKGKEYPFHLSKPLPLIMEQGRQVVPVDYFFNNDLEYLRGEKLKKEIYDCHNKNKGYRLAAAREKVNGELGKVPLWEKLRGRPQTA
nr:hypothetical protein [Tanacetum cinerariifolium]